MTSAARRYRGAKPAGLISQPNDFKGRVGIVAARRGCLPLTWHGRRIKAVEYFEQIACAERECNTRGVFLDEFESVETNDFAAHIYKRATTVARVDGRVGLDPRVGTGFAKFAHSADDSFGTGMAPPGLPMARTLSP